MRLTQWTDYSLRVLMYCAATQDRPERPTVAEIAQVHGISRHHLTKVVMHLSAQGWLETARGRGGGLRLLKPPQHILVGEVIRLTETDMNPVECFDLERSQCILRGHCGLAQVLRQAFNAYMSVLDSVSLADLTHPVCADGSGPVLVTRFGKTLARA
jgi:Rrf2 family nitric oxide-sensitive transcriptional repressor